MSRFLQPNRTESVRTGFSAALVVSALCFLALGAALTFTGCQNGMTDPSTASLSTSLNAALNATGSTSTTDGSTEGTATLQGGIAEIEGGAALIASLGVTNLQAVLQVRREVIPASGSTAAQNGGVATARFDSTLQVKGATASVAGATYMLVLSTGRDGNGGRGGNDGRGGGGGRGPGGPPAGGTMGMPPGGTVGMPRGNRPDSSGRPAPSTLFVYPAPPASGTTTAPVLMPLPTGNANVTFAATGYALSDNSITVPGTITITSQKEGDAVQRSAGLTVTWSGADTFTQGAVVVRNVPDSAARGTRPSTPPAKPVTKTLTSGASVSFTAAELATLQAGKAAIEVTIANAKAINSNKAVLAAHSATRIRVTLQ